MANLLELPQGYTKLPDEDYVALSPDEDFPDNYYVGRKQPVLSPDDVQPGAKVYWHDTNESKVKQYNPITRRWVPSNYVKYVVAIDSDNVPVPVGKLVPKKPEIPFEAKKLSFREAIAKARSLT